MHVIANLRLTHETVSDALFLYLAILMSRSCRYTHRSQPIDNERGANQSELILCSVRLRVIHYDVVAPSSNGGSVSVDM